MIYSFHLQYLSPILSDLPLILPVGPLHTFEEGPATTHAPQKALLGTGTMTNHDLRNSW